MTKQLQYSTAAPAHHKQDAAAADSFVRIQEVEAEGSEV